MFDHALVLGGSIAGLLAAAALSESFDRVTIVDRDELPLDGPDAQRARRGVPQSDQVHHLLSLGRDRIEELVPGFDDELLAAGCRHYDDAADFAQYLGGVWRIRATSDLRITCFQRPIFEWVIRRRVLAKPNVTVHQGVANGLIASEDSGTVIGAKVKNAPDGRILADLVVDATGRGSKAPNWMQDLGFERPKEAHLRVYMGYSTYTVEFPEGALPDGLAGITCASTPAFPKGASIRPIDNGQHVVAAYGMMRQYPPADQAGMKEFLAEIATPSVAEAVSKATVLSEIRTYQMPGNQRRYWEDLKRRPERFVVIGDAVASFDPLYGQGMTMAALGATALRDAVAGSESLDGVGERVQRAIAPWADIAFDTAIAVDASYEGAEFENLERPSPEVLKAGKTLLEIQTEDPEVMIAARRSTLYMDKSALAAEPIRSKITEWKESGRSVRADRTDPTILPGLVATVYSTTS
jgi:2-polyprenyl-6-methoxyphenol hydroxylase-like FAD-dependent oxidoreductase